MSDKKNLEKSVDAIVERLANDENGRFSKSDFQGLIYAVLADPDFKAKKYLLRSDKISEVEYSIHDGMIKFLNKVLKHAGMTDPSERSKVIDSFEYGPQDIEWVMDAVDEAMYLYSESGKNLRMFRDKMLQLAVKKMVRSGKYNGKITYKKSVLDRAAQMARREKASAT